LSIIAGIFRALPLFKGKERLARVFFKERVKHDKDILIQGKFHCKYLVPNIVENIGFEIFINGIYEEETSDFIAKKLPPGGVFLDLGANIGAIAIPVFKKRNDIRIVCVEAAPWIFNYLKQNLYLNKMDNAIALNMALLDQDETKVNFYSPIDKFGKGSLSPIFTNNKVEINSIQVDTLLKNYNIEKVDFIKIDVEGFEFSVFKGAKELFTRNDAPDIIFEFVDWAESQASGNYVGSSQKILLDFGYKIYLFKANGEMEELKSILKKGFSMLYATKNGMKH